MCKLLKGFSVILTLFMVVSFGEKTFAANAYFVWEKTEIEVPVFSALESYKDDYVLKLYVNGVESSDFYVEYETNCSTFSTVLTNKVGRYTVYYKAYSKANYISSEQAIVFNVVDKTAPQITLKDSVVKLAYGKTLDDVNWYSVIDNTCSTSDIIINVDDASVNYQMLGIYSCSIIAADLYGNESTVNFVVIIVDELNPQVQVLKPLTFNYNEQVKFSDYFLCLDNYDGDVTFLLEISNLDLTQLGRQEVVLTVRDYSNNETRVVYQVIVEDKEAPIIDINIAEIVLDISKLESYTRDYFVDLVAIKDNFSSYDKLIVEVDISQIELCVADYKVYMKVIDENKNTTELCLPVKIREFVGPEILISDVIEINVGDNIDLLSLATVVDLYDSEAINRLTVDDSLLDVNNSGSYQVKYTCFNTSGIYTEKVVTINVVETIDSAPFNEWYLYIALLALGTGSLIFVCLVIRKKRINHHNH